MAELNAAAYQLVPLSKLLVNGRNAVLICDGVGVGKTISAAFILKYLTAAYGRPALVVCPPTLLEKWYFELKSKFGVVPVPIRTSEELNLTTDYWDRPIESPRVYIIPSSLLARSKGLSFSGPVVIDEIHNMRNSETQLWKAAKRLVQNSSHRIGLSATPINNSLEDLSAELSILLNLDIHVCEAIVDDGWRREHNNAFYAILTRFSKDRLGIHFAQRQVHDLSIPVSENYRQEATAIIKRLRARPMSEAMYRDEITYFRLASSSARAFGRSTGFDIDSTFEKPDFLKSILSQHIGEPVIVFCEFEETAKELVANISDRPAYLITGSVPMFSREEVLSQFRESSDGVLVMTSVGAEGIDLQFCSTLVNYDLTWNPMVLEQRIGRIDRIGQLKSSIRIYNFVVQGSIDERIIQTLGRKLGLIEDSVLETATVIAGSESSVTDFFNSDDFEVELAKANALAGAVSLSSEIIPEDYDVLPAIDLSFCSAEKVQSAASQPIQMPWLRRDAVGESWYSELVANSKLFDELTARYSS